MAAAMVVTVAAVSMMVRESPRLNEEISIKCSEEGDTDLGEVLLLHKEVVVMEVAVAVLEAKEVMVAAADLEAAEADLVETGVAETLVATEAEALEAVEASIEAAAMEEGVIKLSLFQPAHFHHPSF